MSTSTAFRMENIVIPRITKEETKAMLGSPELIVIDVRQGADWAGSNLKIRGAVRKDSQNLSRWMNSYTPDKTLVFYCS
jgi:rhodanese-related sulfurtransferase